MNSTWRCRSVEAGGGGDCLFHSVAAILERMTLCPEGYSHVRQSLPENFFSGNRLSMVQHLRSVCAERWSRADELDVLNFLVGGAQRESIPGAWFDHWSPTRILRSNGFQALLGCDSVSAVGPDPEGGSWRSRSHTCHNKCSSRRREFMREDR